MIKQLKNAYEQLKESFEDCADEIFPFRKNYLKLTSDEYVSYYHAKHPRISFRRLIYLIPFFELFGFEVVMLLATFPFSNEWVASRFAVFFFAVLFLGIGIFYTLGEQIHGPLLLIAGNCLLLMNSEIGLTFSETLFYCSLLCINIIKCNRFEYYKKLAVNVMQNKLRLELEEMELTSQMEKFNVHFELFQKKGGDFPK